MIFFWRNYRNSAFSLLFFNCIIACIGFYNFALLSRAASNHFFSNWVTFIAVCSFFEMLRGGILQTSFIRNLVAANNTHEKKQIIHTAFWLGLLLSVLISIISALMLFIPLPPTFAITAKFFSIYYLLSFPRSFLLWYYQAKQYHTAYFVIQVFTFGAFCLYLLVGSIEPITTLQVYLFLHFISGVSVFYELRKSLFYPQYFNKQTVERLFSFGKYSLGSQLFINLLKTSDILMISFFLGANSLALFAIPQKLAELFDIVSRSISVHIYPRLVKVYETGNKYLFKSILIKYLLFISLLFVVIAALFTVFSNELLYVLGGKNMEGAVVLLLLFLIAKQAAPFIRLSGVALDAANKPKQNFYRYGVMLFGNLMLNLGCIYFGLGIIGIASVNILVGIIGVFTGYYFLQKNKLNIGFTDLASSNILSALRQVIVRIS